MTAPSITCLMVTRERVTMARHAIDQYIQQDYPNKRLLILSDGEAAHRDLAIHAERRERSDIRVVSVPLGSRSLGALRNLAVRLADTEYICQWDDDDLYHPRRLSTQMQYLTETGLAACLLSEHLQWITSSSTVYWCNWMRPHGRLRWAPAFPGTLMCQLDVVPQYPETGVHSQLSEDTFVMVRLLKEGRATVLRGRGTLFVYVSHGANTWDVAHHLRIPHVIGLGADELLSRRPELERDLPSYSFGQDVIFRSYDDIPVFRYGTDRTLHVIEHPVLRDGRPDETAAVI